MKAEHDNVRAAHAKAEIVIALGGGLGQGRAASSALEGIARNPGASNKVFTPMVLALALTESLVILAWVIAYMLLGKI
jgi:F-type H+-transporting ATPase subunit c